MEGRLRTPVKSVAGTALVCCLLTVSSILSDTSAWAQDASSLYNEKCAGCHTLGGGATVGPDLAPTKNWNTTDLEKSVKDMEKNVGPLSEEETDSLVQFLKNQTETKPAVVADAQPKSAAKTETDVKPVAPVSEVGSAMVGARFFFGDEAFKNGGLSCIACHSIDKNGGNMGPDLTGIGAKMSETALVSACEHTPYKVMKFTYKDRPITHREAVDLAAYLKSLGSPHQMKKTPSIMLIGFILSGIVLAIIALGYRKRNTGVRAKLQRRK